jgi:erythromycin esterase-like protein
MAQLLKDYSELEDARGYAQVVITAHNAHVMKGESSVLPAADDDTMGDRIDALFEGSYFCIGTGFYEGNVNIHTAGTYEENYERKDHF